MAAGRQDDRRTGAACLRRAERRRWRGRQCCIRPADHPGQDKSEGEAETPGSRPEEGHAIIMSQVQALSASSRAAAHKGRRSTADRGRRLTMASLAMPSILLMALINAYPLGFAFVQSLHNGGLLRFGKFIGLKNYINVLTDPAFWQAASF